MALDTNILVYMLDPAYPEHKYCNFITKLSEDFILCLNPTVVHEAYHTLVYGQKWVREDARRKLEALIKHPYTKFFNQTKRICMEALKIAESYDLGGRDSLIIANYLLNGIEGMFTHDEEIKGIGEVRWRRGRIRFIDPVPAELEPQK